VPVSLPLVVGQVLFGAERSVVAVKREAGMSEIGRRQWLIKGLIQVMNGE
jgi:hypothetical protein